MDNKTYIQKAKDSLITFFDEHNTRVFHSKQLEVYFEDDYYHWITNKALRELAEEGIIKSERRTFGGGSEICLYWNKKYRYYKKSAKDAVSLVEKYSEGSISDVLGWQGEMLVSQAFARKQFTMIGKDANEYRGKKWTKSNHNMDFIFEKDGIGYGIEVKNTLSYIKKEDLDIKIELCEYLGLIPVFAVRMMPSSWIKELIDAGGFALIMKYQFFHLTQKELVKEIKSHIELPVDTPKALYDATINRFVNWHNKKVDNPSHLS